MAMFIVLGKLTDQGARDIRNLCRGVEDNAARGSHLGVKVRGWRRGQPVVYIMLVTK